MSKILNIDCSIETASVTIAEDGHILQEAICTEQKNHAAFIQPAIESIMKAAGITLQQLDAIAVTEGPGSYTGLRVGMASAKGLCYVLNKPLIAVSSLLMLAAAVKENPELTRVDNRTLICPMIDARRMEVFTAFYDLDHKMIKEPGAMILDENTFSEILKDQQVIFTGNGSGKFKNICKSNNALFWQTGNLASAMALISYKYMVIQQFSNLAYSEPFYGKDFHSGS